MGDLGGARGIFAFSPGKGQLEYPAQNTIRRVVVPKKHSARQNAGTAPAQRAEAGSARWGGGMAGARPRSRREGSLCNSSVAAGKLVCNFEDLMRSMSDFNPK